MASTRQDKLAKKSTIEKHLNVSPSGTLTVKAGYVYYENSSSDFAQVVITDEYDNIQPVLLSTTKEITEIRLERPSQAITNVYEI